MARSFTDGLNHYPPSINNILSPKASWMSSPRQPKFLSHTKSDFSYR